MPRGSSGALIGGVLLAGGALVLSNALFNVDGGHRAIKYRRLGGVSKEIFNEGRLEHADPKKQRDCKWVATGGILA